MREARMREKDLEKQVAILKQCLQQAEQQSDDLKRREEASKKAYSLLLNTFNQFKSGESDNMIVAFAINLERSTK